jgi:hypothetical protein
MLPLLAPPPGYFGEESAPVERHHLPIITSEALMTAQTSSPFASERSATASLVIDDVR